jgi:hypothetical protein
LEKVFNIKSPEDWYAITTTDIKAQRMGSQFLKAYLSYLDILKELYPSYECLPWRLRQAPNGYWKSWDNRLLARTYEDSAYAAVQDLLPEYNFLPWKFGKAPMGFWSKPENVQQYIHWLAKELHYQSPEDWYNVTNEDFKKHFGGGLLDKLTPRQALAIAYPGEHWVPWKFKQLGTDFWKNRENRQEYILWLGKKIGFKSIDDWYSISMSDIQSNYGGGFIDHYGGYTYKALQDLFPEQKWEPWRFTNLNKKWTNIKDRRLFADHVMEELGMKNLDEWYGITYSAIDKANGNVLRTHYGGSVYRFVKDIYPEHNWNEAAFQKISRSQSRLTETVQKLFPNHRILVNYKHPVITDFYYT